jgi:AraC-like DNA-binding protein
LLQTQHRFHAAVLPVFQNFCSKERLNVSDDIETQLELNASSISCVKFANLLEKANNSFPERKIGLKLASEFQLGDTGIFGLAMMNAANFQQALEFFTRYLPLVADHSSFKATLGKQSAGLEWRYSPFLQSSTEYIDFCIALSLRHFSQYHPRGWKPLSVSLQRSQAESNSASDYRFSNVTKYDCESHGMEFLPSSLQSKNPNADYRIFDTLTDLCETHLSRKMNALSFEDRTKDYILSQLGLDKLTLEKTASHFHIVPRTLQRKLAASGRSFEKLISEVRREYSDFLLLETQNTLEDISKKLGCSSTASYSRMAYEWYGEPASFIRTRLN